MTEQKSRPPSTSTNQLIEWRRQKYNETCSILLGELDLVRKQIPESTQSLMRALSDALFFCTNYADWLQNICIEGLKNIVSDQQITGHPRIAFLQNNFNLVKEYSTNPLLVGFDKLSLEISSRLFQRKITVYNIADDKFLHSYTIDKNYTKEIILIRGPNNHYDTVYPKQFIDNAAYFQNLVLNIIEQTLDEKNKQKDFKDYTNNTYVNLEIFKIETIINGAYLKYINKDKEKNKSITDQFYTDDQILSEIDQYYELNNEISGPSSKNKLAFKNYPLTVTNSQTLDTEQKIVTPTKPIFTQNSKSPKVEQSRAFFGENLTFMDIQRLEGKSERLQYAAQSPCNGPMNTLASPVYYVNTLPPGITSPKYTLKSPNVNEGAPPKIKSQGSFKSIQQASSSTNINQVIIPEVEENSLQDSVKPIILNEQQQQQQQQQQNQPQPTTTQTKNLFQKRTESNKPLKLATAPQISEEAINQIPKQMSLEKKKTIVLEESRQRYSGTLKFFDEAKNYGFIVMDDDKKDIFLHNDDLVKANVPKEFLKEGKKTKALRFSFTCMNYIGRYDKSRKAVDVELIDY